MRRAKSPVKYQPKHVMLLASLLSNLQLRRESYCLQLLKQFVLFPDETDSSQKTVSKYDSLIFSDEEIHTMFKKIETKVIKNKIWAFLNLKYYRIRQAIQKMEVPIQAIKERTEKEHKTFTFIQIKTFSEIRAREIKMKIQREVTVKVPNTQRKESKIVDKKDTKGTKKQQRGSQNKIEISIDIRHHGQCGNYHQSPASPLTRPRQSSIHRSPASNIRSDTKIQYGSAINSPSVAYPISQLHPSAPKIEDRSNRFQSGEEERGRSRSGSITRYELDMEGARKKVINGKEVPVYIKLKRSERTPEEPEYTVIYQPSRIEESRPSGLSRAELQKRQNVRYQYQDSNLRKQAQTGSRVRVTPSKVYGRNIEPSENSPTCQRCNCKHAYGVICTSQRPSQKIIRLRSSSKSNGYMQHLHS